MTHGGKTMKTKICNMVLAVICSPWSIVMIFETVKAPAILLDWRRPVTLSQLGTWICAYKALFWISGGIGLFWRRTWAWYASVIGVTVTLAEIVLILADSMPLLYGASDPHGAMRLFGIVGVGGALLCAPLLCALLLNHRRLLAAQ
jgi:hypothetical protein